MKKTVSKWWRLFSQNEDDRCLKMKTTVVSKCRQLLSQNEVNCCLKMRTTVVSKWRQLLSQRTPGAVFYFHFPYTHPILKADLRLTLAGRVVWFDIRTPGTVSYFHFPYTHPILKADLRLPLAGRVVYFDIRTPGAVFYSDTRVQGAVFHSYVYRGTMRGILSWLPPFRPNSESGGSSHIGWQGKSSTSVLTRTSFWGH